MILSCVSILSFNCQTSLLTIFNSAIAESPLTKSIAIFLAVEYQNSGRIQFIAGILTMIGFGMNIVGYAMKK